MDSRVLLVFLALSLASGFVVNDQVCTTTQVNFRSTPSTSGTILFLSDTGERFVVRSSSTTTANGYVWISVTGRSKNGYVAQNYVTLCNPAPQPTPSGKCPNWKKYSQCDSSWKSNQLGTSDKTICQAGCAMSSVAMSLTSFGINYTPAQLNQWLKDHSGYVSGNLIVWDAVSKLGMGVYANAYSMTAAQLKAHTDACRPVLANVKNGGHWVLVTGVSSYPDVWKVNDPGFGDKATYTLAEMSHWIVYKPPSTWSAPKSSAQDVAPIILIPAGVAGLGVIGYLIYARKMQQAQQAKEVNESSSCENGETPYAELSVITPPPRIPPTAHSYITPRAAPTLITSPQNEARSNPSDDSYLHAAKPAAPFLASSSNV